VGAFRLCPAARAFLRPFSVRPAPLDAGSYSPLPTDRLGKSRLSLATAARPLRASGKFGTVGHGNYRWFIGWWVLTRGILSPLRDLDFALEGFFAMVSSVDY
jgi:hypothetical protein